ncbi:MAG: YojF family protein [Candidatus Cohnella colombiensis]|uniref:YojF family protein n=1 Tax=Candidatus Cohnella colombiensis TaxID=3121368 RepID=A0AA95EV78_9BACL|nr:MAG: YojF family protein [Cohnella sp.]
MKPIDPKIVQLFIDKLKEQELYIHLEMTMGAYASHNDQSKHPAATFIKNARIRYIQGSISGNGPYYRVGLKLEEGWTYSEGLTHYEETETERLILAGHDSAGKLIVALQLSRVPF